MAELESREAMALEASYSVNTSPIIAYVGMSWTFVRIHAGVSARCQLIAIMTDTLETALDIVAVSVLTDPNMFYALIHI